jgi:hypothetical protein
MDADASKELINYIHLCIHSYKLNDIEGANQFLLFASELIDVVFPLGQRSFPKQHVLQVFEEPVRYVY